MSFEAAWARAAPHLDAALAHAGRTHTIDDVEALVRRGEAQFWATAKSAVVTLVEDDPCERRLLVWLAGGDLAELTGQVLPQVEAGARAMGCRRLLVIGRDGWERALKPKGFAPLARVVVKEL
ncbi:MAG: hypothetical protein JWP49_1991 [Phenylobacterium sp.]|nr:hypothetical protein [Phenylobacterium sp.]